MVGLNGVTGADPVQVLDLGQWRYGCCSILPAQIQTAHWWFYSAHDPCRWLTILCMTCGILWCQVLSVLKSELRWFWFLKILHNLTMQTKHKSHLARGDEGQHYSPSASWANRINWHNGQQLGGRIAARNVFWARCQQRLEFCFFHFCFFQF